MMKKTISIILVAAIGLSLYTGVASVTGRKPDSKAIEILSYYEGSYNWVSGDPTLLPATYISADKPVLFTVSVSVYYIDGNEYVSIQEPSIEPKFWVKVWTSMDASLPESLYDTTTFPGTGMRMFVYEFGDNINVFWRVMVQGTPGTVVTVENPAS